jgi:hypothetical protein
MQPFLAMFDRGFRRRRAARNRQYGDQYQNSFHYCPYSVPDLDARVWPYSLSLEASPMSLSLKIHAWHRITGLNMA